MWSQAFFVCLTTFTCLSHPARCGNINSILWWIQIMELLPCNFLSSLLGQNILASTLNLWPCAGTAFKWRCLFIGDFSSGEFRESLFHARGIQILVLVRWTSHPDSSFSFFYLFAHCNGYRITVYYSLTFHNIICNSEAPGTNLSQEHNLHTHSFIQHCTQYHLPLLRYFPKVKTVALKCTLNFTALYTIPPAPTNIP